MLTSKEIFIKIGALLYWTALLESTVPAPETPITHSQSGIDYMVEQTHRLQDEVFEAIRQLEAK